MGLPLVTFHSAKRRTVLRHLRSTLWLPVLLATGLLLPGCSSETSNSKKAPALDFLWIPKELNNQVFETGRQGATNKAEALTKLGDYDVNIHYFGTESATDVEGQAEVVRQAEALGVEGVAISCNAPEGLRAAIDEVTAAGIPVMTFDSDSPESSRFTYLGVDNEQGGGLAARILGEVMVDSSRRKVALISGVQGAANLEARVAGFQTTLAREFPNLEIVGTVYCDDQGIKAASLIEGLLANNPDLGGFFFVGLWPMFACENTDCSARMPLWNAAARAGSVKTVAFDTLEFQLSFVQEGMVSGLIGQKYWGWGFDAVQMLYDRVVNHKQFQDWTDSGIDVVCPNNYSEMVRMWQENDFTSPLTPCEINGVTLQ
jgi:ribose transport system substrate-binding protein